MVITTCSVNCFSNRLLLFKPETLTKADCMDVLTRCCKDDDCLLLSQINDLFQCVETLQQPPGSLPRCTETCRNLISTVLATDYGVELLSCNCSNVQNVPKIKHLCRPFQLNAKKKCYATTPSSPGRYGRQLAINVPNTIKGTRTQSKLLK